MRIAWPVGLVPLLAAAALAAASAGPADDFAAAYAKAEAASRQAVALKAQWTTTVETLKSAQDAAQAGKYDEAVALARKAEALAVASIAQAREQATAWQSAVIR
jgi:hypothetical protein